MPASRIPFALADLMSEIKNLGCDQPTVDIHLDHETHDRVVRELVYHHGAQLKRDDRYRGYGIKGSAAIYSGMRLIAIPPGNRNG